MEVLATYNVCYEVDAVDIAEALVDVADSILEDQDVLSIDGDGLPRTVSVGKIVVLED
jgi:hypothetical protein